MWGFFLSLSLALLGFVAGGQIGATQVRGGDGLAGGATVFLWAAGGTLFALVAGIVLARRLSARARRTAALVAVALALPVLIWLGSRIAQSRPIVP